LVSTILTIALAILVGVPSGPSLADGGSDDDAMTDLIDPTDALEADGIDFTLDSLTDIQVCWDTPGPNATEAEIEYGDFEKDSTTYHLKLDRYSPQPTIPGPTRRPCSSTGEDGWAAAGSGWTPWP
jgi:hypothetical protein